MNIEADTIEEYVRQLSEERQKVIEKVRRVIQENLPRGFEETLSYGMIGYVIPHSIYPDGYHCNPKEPLPFLSIGSQKNFISIYHMGIYAFPDLLDWFVAEYPKYVKTKLDMGKSCIRLKKMDTIPYELIAELCRKITVDDYIAHYEAVWKK
ncbi:DUF1801 domain-containing protein [Sporosarcina sp. BI001-red]|uniref:DUF1801 domain-containing protein n=1 Tax=Sporosarcina sp. BI001-red TaxID=2282866 RepID=UPI000E227C86|nr:DUF1801 domain-containing protein [Sporosarcina sp. BI001-red]REB05248.1 DUF1801 domain-containing protein [Sporosarcina sp. BI001-red]